MLFIRHATTPGMRAACFPADEDADPAALSRAATLRPLVAGRVAWVSPGRAAWQTALAMGLEPRVCDALGEADCGRWRGLPYERVAREEPEALARWLSDPHATPHGGESLAALAQRVATWLDTTRAPTPTPQPAPAGPPPSPDQHAPGGRRTPHAPRTSTEQRASAGRPEVGGAWAGGVVVCEAGVIRAAIGHALGLGPMGAARFDLAPLSATELVAAQGGWRVAYVNRKV
ncbi:histidine phosphatase family protein [Nonomuraea sp. FMUSA5-5]|uniref:Histidine phosphatase family protein n=1 Tax=Nonomuraea composti TaxID=2720023 RepID=A0ABX1B9S9_9ACTN|nr:histidine phosphatase family protein [Nonomuraea sp. FMUSA5-5]NJP94560.1 histidine phosphatase family protein [Nonomuraea sp. FMUSA5-5]